MRLCRSAQLVRQIVGIMPSGVRLVSDIENRPQTDVGHERRTRPGTLLYGTHDIAQSSEAGSSGPLAPRPSALCTNGSGGEGYRRLQALGCVEGASDEGSEVRAS